MKQDHSAVYEAQQYLRAATLLHPALRKIVPDGIYGEETAQAVRDFRKRAGLPDGRTIDLDVWNALVKTNAAARAEAAPPIPIAPVASTDLPLRRGDSGSPVLTAQQMLRCVAQQYGGMPAPPLDGVFGVETQQAVLRWQETGRLPQTGEIDKATWNLLARFYTMR